MHLRAAAIGRAVYSLTCIAHFMLTFRILKHTCARVQMCSCIPWLYTVHACWVAIQHLSLHGVQEHATGTASSFPRRMKLSASSHHLLCLHSYTFCIHMHCALSSSELFQTQVPLVWCGSVWTRGQAPSFAASRSTRRISQTSCLQTSSTSPLFIHSCSQCMSISCMSSMCILWACVSSGHAYAV